MHTSEFAWGKLKVNGFVLQRHRVERVEKWMLLIHLVCLCYAPEPFLLVIWLRITPLWSSTLQFCDIMQHRCPDLHFAWARQKLSKAAWICRPEYWFDWLLEERGQEGLIAYSILHLQGKRAQPTSHLMLQHFLAFSWEQLLRHQHISGCFHLWSAVPELNDMLALAPRQWTTVVAVG